MYTSTTTRTKYTYADGDSIPYSLKRSQRSDCCKDSRALFEVKFSYGTLYFCNHHYNKHKDAILRDSVEVLDESSVLVK